MRHKGKRNERGFMKIYFNVPTHTPMQLKLGKIAEDAILSYKGRVVNKMPTAALKLNNKEALENQSIDVFVEGLELVTETNQVVYTFTSTVFAKNTLAELIKQGENALLMFEDLLLGTIAIRGHLDGVFARRSSFKAQLVDANEINIVRYAWIHQHTEYSLLDGIIRIKDLVKKVEHGCAITDHGNMYGALEFYKEMTKAGKKPMIGCEVYIETIHKDMKSLPENPEEALQHKRDHYQGDHMLLIAKNNVGLKNLYKIVSLAYGSFYSKAHVTYDVLEKYSEGLIATSACIGSTFGQAILNEDWETGKLFVDKMIHLFGKDDFYIEIQRHQFEEEDKVMNMALKIAKKYDLKIIAGIDAHFLNKEDAFIHELWLCQQTKTTIDNPNRIQFPGTGYHTHTSDEAVELFKDIPEALDNTLELLDKCNVNMDFEGYHMPDYPLPEGFTSQDEYFRHLVREGYVKLFKGTPKFKDPVYVERIKFEIETILKMGFPSYLTIVADFIGWSRERDISGNPERYFPKSKYNWNEIPKELLVKKPIGIGPGRGSAAGSLVAYCLGITQVDPIEYGLLFARFLNPDRISMPDIDTDIADDRREEVFAYMRYKYGINNVSRIITFGSAKAKAVVRDIARVLGKPYSVGDKIAKAIPTKPNITLKDALIESPEFKEMYESDEEVKEIVNYAFKVEGLRKNVGQHACGLLVSPRPVSDYMPQVLIENEDTGVKEPTTQFTMSDVEEMGLVKIDFLGLRTLGVASNVVDTIERAHPGTHVDFDSIPLTDFDVYKWLAKGNTAGVFQFESQYMTKIIMEMYQDFPINPKANGEVAFLRMCDATALGRPGPMDEIPNYINNMLHSDKITYDAQQLRKQLEPTYGIITYQEQTMAIVMELAGFSQGDSDKIRKAMGKKIQSILDEYGEYFIHGSVKKNIKGCVANGIPESTAKHIWEKMAKFGAYAFNKSHAVSYSYLSARTAWLSYYYPVEFMIGVLNSFIKNQDKLKGYIAVCKKKGIQILPPDVNKSLQNFSYDNGRIRFGLMGLRNMGKISESLINERTLRGEFKSLVDLVSRMMRFQKFNKRALESLVYSGALDSFEGTRKAKIEALQSMMDFAKEEKVMYERQQQTFMALFDEHNIPYVAYDVSLELDEEIEQQEKLQLEEKYAGFYITAHPLDIYAEFLDNNGVGEISLLVPDSQVDTEEEDSDDGAYNNMPVKVAGIIKELEVRYTRTKGEAMCTFTLEDQSASIKCVTFPKEKAKYNKLLQEGSIVVINGKLQKDDFGAQIRVEKVVNASEASMDSLQAAIINVLASADPSQAREQYTELVALANEYQGNTNVIFVKANHEAIHLARKIEFTPESLNAIQSIFGEQNVEVVYKN